MPEYLTLITVCFRPSVGPGIELVVGLPNGYLKDMSDNVDHALSWVKDNIQQFYPQTRIVGIAVGNEKNAGIVDSPTKLHYDNLLDAQIDAAYAALEDAGFKKMEVIITETGWASRGDPSEEVATPENARTYNYNLRKRLALRKGTPMRPKIMLKASVFAMFNEDDKPGPNSERNFGLWKPDGSISYDVGFPALKSSAIAISPFSIKW
ncbi:hypothetical protein SOVF_034340 [Spinacia oleracea]|nr:hypothetical protein SOVF_034340 [Spinacia oleracea]